MRGGFGGGGMGRAREGRQRPEENAELTPEQRERLRQILHERLERMGGARQNLGNRNPSTRQRNMVRAGLTYNLGSSALDAAPYSLNGVTSEKPSWTRQRFGVTFGGSLPFLNFGQDHRSMIFLNYQGQRARNAFSSYSVVPTDSERQGDFSRISSVIYDPLSNAPFPANQLPAVRLQSAALGLLRLYPQPNYLGGIQNFALVRSIPSSNDSLNLRWMQTLTAKDHLNLNMSWMWGASDSLQALGFRDTSSRSGRNYGLGWSHNFSPSLMANLTFRYNKNRDNLIPYFAFGDDISGQLGIQGVSRSPANFGPPNLNFTNYTDLTDGAFSNRVTHTFNSGGTFSDVRGPHTLTFGFQWGRQRWNSLAEMDARGSFTFTGSATSGRDAAGQALPGTGYDLADFLLGLPQQATVRYNGADTYFRSATYNVFVQDVWRMRSALTLNLGLRYEYFAPPVEKYGRMANLDIAPGWTAVSAVTPGSVGPYSGKFSDGLIDPDRNNLAPRLGIAWRPKRSTILRAGYSIFYDASVYNRIPSRLAAQPPFATALTFVNGPDGLLTLSNAFSGSPSGDVFNTYAVDRHYRIPYAQTWTSSVQFNLPRDFLVDLAYVGTKGTRLVIQRLPNRVLPDSGGRRRIADATGFTYDSTEGNSILHSLQVRFSRRMRRGLSWNANYTWSKSIDNASTIGGAGSTIVQDEDNLAAERGLSSFDRRHALTANAFLSSPFGPMGAWLRDNTLPSRFLRGWTLSLGLTLQSGTPFTARVLGNVADAGGSGSIGNARADATGLPVQGKPFFNTAAFAVPLPGTFGNAGRNTIPGPRFFSMNAGFGRSFRLGDDFRRQLMFRIEGTNITNTLSITGLGTVVNARDYGLATRAGGMRQIEASIRLGF